MNIEEITGLIEGKILGRFYKGDYQISGAYVCDMLSRVVSSIESGQVWITILNSINVVAVASLSECPCVILADDVKMPDDVIKRADENNVMILSTGFSAYKVCGLIYGKMEMENEEIQM